MNQSEAERKKNQHFKHKKSCLCKTDFFSKARWNFVELTEKHLTVWKKNAQKFLLL